MACNCSNSSKQEVKHSYYNKSIKGEKYQLDLSKLLISWSDCFLANQSILINCHTENQNKFLWYLEKNQHGKPDMLVKTKYKEFHQHFENSGNYFWIQEIGRKLQ